MKKYIPTMLSFLILVFPIFHIIACLAANGIIADKMIIVPLVSFIAVFVISLIRKIPYVAKIFVAAIMLILVFVGSSLFYLLGGSAEFTVFENATVDEFETTFFEYPDNYKNAQVYRYSDSSFFSLESETLILKYDENDFIKAKSEITQNYHFFTEEDFNGDILPEFEYEKFDFSICKSDKNFPQVIYFIGFNDETDEIAFVWFNNLELDRVSDIELLLSIDCGWKYIERSRNNSFFNIFYAN